MKAIILAVFVLCSFLACAERKCYEIEKNCDIQHLKEKYIEIFHKDKDNHYSVITNWIAFYNHNDSSGLVPTDAGLCENMCRNIKIKNDNPNKK